MSRAVRALAAFNPKIRLIDGSPRWPHLTFHQTDAVITNDHWVVPNVLGSHSHHAFDFLCDNRVVAVQANGEAGKLFMRAHLALCAHMEEVPGSSRSSQPWESGSFRYGYRFSHETKSKSDEEQFSTMMECLVAMADAANRFSRWADQKRRNPVFRMRVANEPAELAALQEV